MSENKKTNNKTNKIQIDESKNIIMNPLANDNKTSKNANFNFGYTNHIEKQKVDLIVPTSKSHKIRKSTIITISILIFLIIFVAVLIIGHFKYGWFMKKNDLIIEQNRQENSILQYKEKKIAYNYYDLAGEDENENEKINKNTLLTDFIVGMNKRTKMNSFFDFKENDYLYESFLLIINLTLINETSREYLGGMNIFDETKSAEELIKLNDELFLKTINKEKNSNMTNKTSFNENIPFCKFYYYLNGTIDRIYFPEGMNEFYKSAIIDLIEKITPKLSKSLYQNKNNKRRLQNGQEDEIKLNYEKIIKNDILEKIITYEEKVQKEFDEKNNELNSKIIRTFNSSGDITSLEMKGKAIFKSPNPTKKNDLKNSDKNNLRFVEETEAKNIYFESNQTQDNFGINQFSINVSSNMELIRNEIEPKILEKLRIISKFISFEIYNDTNNNQNEILIYKEKIENISNNNSEKYQLKSNDTRRRNLYDKNIINFPCSYNVYSTLYDKYFLNQRVMILQRLYINPSTNLRRDSIILRLGYREYTLHEIDIYHSSYYYPDYNSKYIKINTDDITSWFNVFGYSIGVNLYLAFYVSHGINYNVISNQMYTRGYASYDVSIGATYGPNFFFVSFGAGIRGTFMGGKAYLEANSIPGSSLARFKIYKDFIPCSVDIYFYFTINIIFWKKTFEKTFNIFRITYIFEDYYDYY